MRAVHVLMRDGSNRAICGVPGLSWDRGVLLDDPLPDEVPDAVTCGSCIRNVRQRLDARTRLRQERVV